MKILGIVAEYNPFHLGHKYQLEMARKISNCDVVAVVMSGNYVQRGEPAIIEKYKRAEIAVKNGVDLVIELPFPFSCQNAELFALGAIRELKKLDVSTISFGCESTNIEILHSIADIQLNDNHKYNSLIKEYMNKGISYPNAANNAVKMLLNLDSNCCDDLILLPNNTLGLEYIKTARNIAYEVEFLPIKRYLTQHNDKAFKQSFASATAIRTELKELNFKKAKIALTGASYTCIKEYYADNKILNSLDNYLNYIYYKIISCGKEYLRIIYDISEGLENKIYDNVYKHNNLDNFILAIKSKRYTYSRIRRILLNILLDITYDDIQYFKGYDNNYIKVLAFNEYGKRILSHAKDNGTSIITKFSDYKRNHIDTNIDKVFKLTNKSTNLYYLPFLQRDIYMNSEYKKNSIYFH